MLTVIVDRLISSDDYGVPLAREAGQVVKKIQNSDRKLTYMSNELTVSGFVSTPSASMMVMLWLSIETWYVGPQLRLTNRRRYLLPFCTGVTDRATFGPPATRPFPLMVVALAIL